MLSMGCKGKDLLYRLDEAVDQGWLSKQKHSTLPLQIYCYTNKTQYERYWTDLTRFARGVVVDKEGEVIFKGFTKFHNLGEKSSPFPPKHGDYLSFEKLDGSYFQLAQYEGNWIGTTKASFDNEYIDFGMKFVMDNNCIGPYLSTDLTLMSEVVIPESLDGMRRAVQHEPGVYFLGATQTATRKDLNPTMFYGLWQGEFPKFYRNSIDELLQDSNQVEGTEGWVVRYSNGLRLKIKTTWYLRLFRLISRLDNTVKEQILQGLSLDQILVDVPEELTEEITELWNTISEKISSIKIDAWDRYKGYIRNGKPNRKMFAEAIKKDSLKSLLFQLYDEKDITESIRDSVIKGNYDETD